ncbi:MAG: DNA alkylation repair protein [Flavobacteriaceae bacterium]|jgi:3-methyladenine DNA glycosylase AlkD|nr:DNA alkylation repair protein [Flavobacteriaceae bacterium]
MFDTFLQQLQTFSNPEKKEFLPHFFKTGKGEYGEGDRFLGVVVPDIRKVAKQNLTLSLKEIEEVLQSEYHECRLCALLILVEKFKHTKSEQEKKEIFDFYLSHTKNINNWDLVDLSVKDIIGEFLLNKDRKILHQLAESQNLWEQRMSVIATFPFIKKNDFDDTLALSEKLLHHPHDLIHKAAGWMLREVGKRDKQTLVRFLDKHRRTMPRTMLRYAIEKFPQEERIFYLKR